MGKETKDKDYNDRLTEALKTYISRKNRESHPDGYFDDAGRWYPSEDEECDCCGDIRTPSISYPYSLMIHCRTITHIANLYDVLEDDLRREARKYLKEKRPKIQDKVFYKAVAIVDGKCYSIFDGETQYKIGETLHQTAYSGHGGGYFVYQTLEDAEEASVPECSVFIDEPRAILKVKCKGKYCRYGNGKIAFSYITPIELLKTMSKN